MTNENGDDKKEGKIKGSIVASIARLALRTYSQESERVFRK